jgi:hypothetical protein
MLAKLKAEAVLENRLFQWVHCIHIVVSDGLHVANWLTPLSHDVDNVTTNNVTGTILRLVNGNLTTANHDW